MWENGFKDGKTLLSAAQFKPSGENWEILSNSPTAEKKKKKILWGVPYFPPLSHFVVWDHTRTIMAYWPSSVSMGTEKPFLPLLRLESYLLLFYFGIAHADYLEARCRCSAGFYHSHNIYLWYHYLQYKTTVKLLELHDVPALCLKTGLWCQNGSSTAASQRVN